METKNTAEMNEVEWDNFVKGDLYAIMVKYGLDSIKVIHTSGKRGEIKTTSKGDVRAKTIFETSI